MAVIAAPPADSKRNLLGPCLHRSWLSNFSVLSFHLPRCPQATRGSLQLQFRHSVCPTTSPWSLLLFVHSMNMSSFFQSLDACGYSPTPPAYPSSHVWPLPSFPPVPSLPFLPFLISHFSFSCPGLAPLALSTISLAPVLAHMWHCRCSFNALTSIGPTPRWSFTPFRVLYNPAAAALALLILTISFE